jgi:hypothetical protein
MALRPLRLTKESKMKTFISAVALATILSTPALAEKTPVKPQPNECFTQEDVALQMTIYHLDQVAMMLEQMRADILQAYPKKPVDDEKAG